MANEVKKIIYNNINNPNFAMNVINNAIIHYKPHVAEILSFDFEKIEYTMPYIDGPTLYDLYHSDNCTLNPEDREHFITSSKHLISTLEECKNSDSLVNGDWAAHNLIWDQSTLNIVNVDLEGFITYPNTKKVYGNENYVPVIINWINAVVEKITHKFSAIDNFIQDTLHLVNYSIKKNKSSYNGSCEEAGYHSLYNPDNGKLIKRGQREIKTRIDHIINEGKVDFKEKTVLDIGSNQGSLSCYIKRQCHAKKVIGIDYNHLLVNVANKQASYDNNGNNLQFYSFDLVNDPFDLIKAMTGEPDTVDIIMLLSMCMWLSNWKEVVKFCYDYVKECVIFESNGSKNTQDTQVEYLHSLFTRIQLVSEISDDDKGQKFRKCYVCWK